MRHPRNGHCSHAMPTSVPLSSVQSESNILSHLPCCNRVSCENKPGLNILSHLSDGTLWTLPLIFLCIYLTILNVNVLVMVKMMEKFLQKLVLKRHVLSSYLFEDWLLGHSFFRLLSKKSLPFYNTKVVWELYYCLLHFEIFLVCITWPPYFAWLLCTH